MLHATGCARGSPNNTVKRFSSTHQLNLVSGGCLWWKKRMWRAREDVRSPCGLSAAACHEMLAVPGHLRPPKL